MCTESVSFRGVAFGGRVVDPCLQSEMLSNDIAWAGSNYSTPLKGCIFHFALPSVSVDKYELITNECSGALNGVWGID